MPVARVGPRRRVAARTLRVVLARALRPLSALLLLGTVLLLLAGTGRAIAGTAQPSGAPAGRQPRAADLADLEPADVGLADLGLADLGDLAAAGLDPAVVAAAGLAAAEGTGSLTGASRSAAVAPDAAPPPGRRGAGTSELPVPALPLWRPDGAQLVALRRPARPDGGDDEDGASRQRGLLPPWMQPWLYGALNRGAGSIIGLAFPAEIPGLVLSDALTQALIDQSTLDDPLADAALHALANAGLVYGMDRANRGLNQLMVGHLGVWRFGFQLVPRNPGMLAATSFVQLLLEGPFKAGLRSAGVLPLAERTADGRQVWASAGDYWLNLGFDVAMHAAAAGLVTVLGTREPELERLAGAMLRGDPVAIQTFGTSFWGVSRWRLALAAGAFAGFARAASTLATDPPPPGPVGDTLLGAARLYQEVARVRRAPSPDRFGELLWSRVLNDLETVGTVGWGLVTRNTDPVLLLRRLWLTRKAERASQAGDEQQARRLRADPAFALLDPETVAAVVAARSRSGRALAMAAAHPDPQGPVERAAHLWVNVADLAGNLTSAAVARWWPGSESDAAARDRQVAEAMDHARQNLARIDQDAAAVGAGLRDALAGVAASTSAAAPVPPGPAGPPGPAVEGTAADRPALPPGGLTLATDLLEVRPDRTARTLQDAVVEGVFVPAGTLVDGSGRVPSPDGGQVGRLAQAPEQAPPGAPEQAPERAAGGDGGREGAAARAGGARDGGPTDRGDPGELQELQELADDLAVEPPGDP